ncbi:MAG: hypothetical protein A2649_00735 [Candidatus Yanofskybacteria bacterium RIFCSPHIGHO2_01_FULL_41_26]|uniref:DUF4258 domain-containing protein n=1 Tax=Candidatus Yanofskybacteria bacterium RIFCSPHIGHO2_01_FULL_41_26 TaxID=1802661 RepID=A0A1F8EDN4_9BACT|nr:MAG: hypothetical protein A2649_00735 [Candidatus Yanofskybacteria bacterium RIFCSPHIGHO2_01_FULL_41_26]
MRFKVPKNNERFSWTNHVVGKMLFYGLSEQRVKRVINRPDRVEEGVAPNTIACMQVGGSKKHRQEIWVMYQQKSQKLKIKSPKLAIISTWRYPGKSPAKNPIPPEILAEIKNLV